MTVLNLTAYKPVSGTLGDANQVSNGFAAIETIVNGQLDDNNVKAAAAVALSKLASTGQVGAGVLTLAAAGKTAVQIADTGAQLSGITIGGDTNLYRSAAGVLKTDGQFVAGGATIGFQYSPAAVGGYGFHTKVGVEANPRFTIDAAGTMAWGPGGASAIDTNLYRFAAGFLKTDSNLQVAQGVDVTGNISASALTGAFLARTKAAAGSPVLVASVTGDTVDRFNLQANGTVNWGPGGAAAQDTNLYRNGASSLRTDGGLYVGSNLVGLSAIYSQPTGSGGAFIYNPTIVGGFALVSQVQGEANARFGIGAIGGMSWGAGGASAFDSNLYRNAANQLKTDGSLLVGASALTGGVCKTTTSTLAGGPPSSPADGDIWIATAVDGNGTRWTFQYNSSETTYKWVFIGGSATTADVAATETTASATFVALATAQSLTVARAGLYDISFGAMVSNSVANATLIMGIHLAAVNTSDIFGTTGVIGSSAVVSRSDIITVASAATVLDARYNTTAGTASISRRYVHLTPRKII